MSTIVKDTFIPKNDDTLNLRLELPPGTPKGEVEIVVTVKSRKPANRMAELEGRYKGQIWTADDFDAPLEDFAEYM